MTTPDKPAVDPPADKPEGQGADHGAPVKGLWDEKFARFLAITGTIFAVILIVVLIGLGLIFGRGEGVKLPVTQWLDGSFADRARFYLALVLMGIGGLLLVVAGCLAGLEVRATLKSPAVSTTETTATSTKDSNRNRMLVPVKEIVTAVTETIVRARGTAIVAIAGVAVLGLATLTATSIDDGASAPAAKTGDSATSTGAPATDQ